MTSMFWPALGGALIATGIAFGLAACDADGASRDITVHGPRNEDSPSVLASDDVGSNTVVRLKYADGLHCVVGSRYDGGIWCGWKP